MDDITVADIAYPLITKKIMGVFQQQLVHVRNGCISDNPNRLPYVTINTINFHNTGHHLPHYQSLCGTSKVESVHSVLDRAFYTQGELVLRFLMPDWVGGFWATIGNGSGHLVGKYHLTPCLQMLVSFFLLCYTVVVAMTLDVHVD